WWLTLLSPHCATAGAGFWSGLGDGVLAGLLDGGDDVGEGDRGVGLDGHVAALERDVDLLDTGDLGDLLGDVVDAVSTGHSSDGVVGDHVGFLSSDSAGARVGAVGHAATQQTHHTP